MTSPQIRRPAALRACRTLLAWRVSGSAAPPPRPVLSVERLFSKAGAMHHDLKGSMEDGSLEHSLIAHANTE